MGRRYARSYDQFVSPDTGLGHRSGNAAGGGVDGIRRNFLFAAIASTPPPHYFLIL